MSTLCLIRWSAVSRTERYRKRCGEEGSSSIDETNPLPRLIDPITLEPVVTPAISPFGHVMGLATWKVTPLCHCLKCGHVTLLALVVQSLRYHCNITVYIIVLCYKAKGCLGPVYSTQLRRHTLRCREKENTCSQVLNILLFSNQKCATLCAISLNCANRGYGLSEI